MARANDESDDEWDYDEDDDDGYIPCPHCGETMLEAADYCPACDRWITSETTPKKQHAWWVIVIVLLLVVTFVMSALLF